MRPGPPPPVLSLRDAIDALNGPASPRDGAAWRALHDALSGHLRRRFRGDPPEWAEYAVQDKVIVWSTRHAARRAHKPAGEAFYRIDQPEAWCAVVARRVVDRALAKRQRQRDVSLQDHDTPSDAEIGLADLHDDLNAFARGDHPAWRRLVDASCAKAAAGSASHRRLWADLLVRRWREGLSPRDLALLAAPDDVDAAGEPTKASLQRAQRQPAVVAAYLRRDLHALPEARPDDPDDLYALERFLHDLCRPRPRRKDTP